MSTDARLPLASLSIADDRLQQLKQLLPEAFTEGKVDFEKLKQALGETVETGRERYGLNWAGKSEAIRTLMAPGTGTLRPCPEESVEFDTTENLIIEGDNLEVLKLLQKSYYGKVKLIYIDPPYNTGNDFIYPDDFRDSLKTYQRYTGQLDDEGNATSSDKDRSGRFHSNWLNMMYPRLHLAWNLLREDGVIFVSIDDNEVHNLRILMNEIFGEENFIGNIVWNSTKSVTNTALISVSHTHNICYAKCKEYFIDNRSHFRLPESGDGFNNPDGDKRGPWKADPFQVGGWRPNQQYEIKNPITGDVYKPNSGCSWKNDHKKFLELMKDDRIVFGVTGEAGPQRKRFLSEALSRGKVSKTLWDDVDTTTNATSALKLLFEGNSIFNNPKPVGLLSRFLTLGDYSKNGVVLDFFGGSGTTAHAALEMNEADGGNRKFILVQLPEPTDKPEYPTIAHITRERVRRVIARIKKEHEEKTAQGQLLEAGNKVTDLGFRALRLDASNFRLWDGAQTPTEATPLAEQLALYADNMVPGRSEQDVLFELALKSGLPLSVKTEAVVLGKQNGYRIVHEDRVCIFCLANPVQQTTLDAARALKPDALVCLDVAFTGQDTLKTNTVLQMRDAGIRFQTA
jgi:adenine-specific DNA-methyltransferase